MVTEIHYPEVLAPEKLDEYLARGWFRMGSMIFTCHYLCFENGLYSAVWTRLPLKDYRFKKSLRKIMNRNKKRFNVVVRQAKFDREKDELYQLHKSRFEGYIAKSLHDSIFGSGDKRKLYNTWETCIYEGDKLIAASFFDLGQDSLASIMGLFNPDYEKFSLGIYTMLLEIRFGKAHNMQFYYPGYVVPGYKRFDYKLRVGDTEFYDLRNRQWLPSYKMVDQELPAEMLNEQLAMVEQALKLEGINTKKYIYQLYDKKLFGFDDMDYFRAPLFLLIAIYPNNPNKWLVLEYDYLNRQYKFSQVAKFNDPLMFIYDLFKDVDQNKSLLDFLFNENTIFRESDIEKTVANVKQIISRVKLLANV